MPSEKFLFVRIIFASALAALVFPNIALCEVIHEIDIGDSTTHITSVLILMSQRPIDYWDLEINLPENALLERVNDDMGRVEYTLSGNLLAFRTNAKKSSRHIVNITYSIPNPIKTHGLAYLQLNLFGFENDTTYAEITPGLPYIFAQNSQTEHSDNLTKARTTGPMNVIIAYGGKNESEHYFTNSDVDLEEVEKIYPVIERITGIKSPVKFGIAVLPESEYLEDYRDWSAGTFNGLILVKENDDPNEITATIIHETVHGFNQFALGWDMTNVTWFDEGTASYVTSIAYRMLGEQQPELFGEKTVWREKNLIYTLPPKKTPEDLYNYYQAGRKFMYYWYPQSNYDRDFGYAYSELFIRQYVMNHGSELQEVYGKLLIVNQTVYDKDEANRIILEALGTDFKPCYYGDLSDIDSCTKKLNDMGFKVPDTEGKELGQFIEEPDIPKTEPNPYISYFDEIFQNLIYNLGQIYSFFAGSFSIN